MFNFSKNAKMKDTVPKIVRYVLATSVINYLMEDKAGIKSPLARPVDTFIKSMEQDDSTIALTKNGQPVSVIMTLSRYESLMETIDILSDKQILRSLEKSKKDFKSGNVLSHDEVWKD